jgi:hypothetical protein
MKKRSIVLVCLSVFFGAVFLSGCAGLQKPTESNFKDPVVTLDYVDVAHYWGFWYYNPKVEPTAGKAGHNAAPLDYAFIFNIQNPNSFPIEMNSLKFACVIDGFEINSGYSTETMWIPAGKTNQLKVEVMYDYRGALLSLGVVAGMQLKEKGVKLGDQLVKIWSEAPDFTFPVGVTQGAAVFKADGITKVVGFEGSYPQ